ncbi:flagellar motor protein MotB [Candidatus Omnitrophus magneticus]|uniref:Flagellar motor protein MotB n=1 Tax=Candidatus Omnitrophus magneticus TaxID=1609969 RepID=A0A0F0CMA0_9BACT|nr:flagellar motor protein MotB [Candidatus Omnitrophus magneticus]
MRSKKFFVMVTALIFMAEFLMSGCALNYYKQSPKSRKKINELEAKVDELERLRKEEQDKFANVKDMLEQKLRDQIDNDQISLKMRDEGLVIVLSDNILFASGKAELRDEALPILQKVSAIIKSEVPDKNIGVGGHTDNVPIKYSNWKSNWELSTARATTVLYYLESQGVLSERLSATGYGEYRPVSSNDTARGRAQNRRVEIMILPEYKKEKQEDTSTTYEK